MEESVWFMEILKAFVHRQTLEAFIERRQRG